MMANDAKTKKMSIKKKNSSKITGGIQTQLNRVSLTGPLLQIIISGTGLESLGSH